MIQGSSKYTNLDILQAWFDFKMPTWTLQVQIAALIIYNLSHTDGAE